MNKIFEAALSINEPWYIKIAAGKPLPQFFPLIHDEPKNEAKNKMYRWKIFCI